MKWPSRRIACARVRNEYSRLMCSQRPCTSPTLRIGEIVDGFLQEIGFRHKIGVEDRDELALGGLQAVFQGARLESGPVVPVDVMNVNAAPAPFLGGCAGDLLGFVRRIVQHLDVKPVARIVEGTDRIDHPLHDIHLVVKGELNGDPRQFLEALGDDGRTILVPPEKPNQQVPVKTVEAEDGQDREIGDYDRPCRTNPSGTGRKCCPLSDVPLEPGHRRPEKWHGSPHSKRRV